MIQQRGNKLIKLCFANSNYFIFSIYLIAVSFMMWDYLFLGGSFFINFQQHSINIFFLVGFLLVIFYRLVKIFSYCNFWKLLKWVLAELCVFISIVVVMDFLNFFTMTKDIAATFWWLALLPLLLLFVSVDIEVDECIDKHSRHQFILSLGFLIAGGIFLMSFYNSVLFVMSFLLFIVCVSLCILFPACLLIRHILYNLCNR